VKRSIAPFVCVMMSSLAGCGREEPPQQSSLPPQPRPAAAPPQPIDDAALALWNRGIGLMGQFAFEEAERTFAELVGRLAAPTVAPEIRLDARFNLGLSILNQTSDGAQQRAIAIFDEILAARPNDPRASFAAGLGELFIGEPERALARFEAAARADGADPYALYYVGQCLEFAGRSEEAVPWYRSAIERDPYLRSSLLGLQRVLGRIGRADEAAEALAQFQRLATNPQSRLAEFKYTRMGRKAEVVPPPGSRRPFLPPEGELFADVRPTIAGAVAWRTSLEGAVPPSITTVDIDGDGRLDLFCAAARADGGNVLLRALEGDAAFEVVDVPFAATTNVRAALWGDVDNDGLVDVYLCRDGTNELWRQVAAGRFENIAAASRTALDGSTLDGALADLDHDGDLDLYLARAEGGNVFLANALDGTFLPATEPSGGAGSGRPTRQVVVGDLDRDRDADLLLVGVDGRVEWLRNDRLWRFEVVPVPATLASAVLVDREVVGRPAIVGVRPDGTLEVLERGDDGGWTSTTPAPLPLGIERDRSIAAVDATGDGLVNYLARSSMGIVLYDRTGGTLGETPMPPVGTDVFAWTTAVRTLRGPSIVCLTNEGPAFLDPGPGRGRFATFVFSGRTDPSQSMRSNTSGIGVAATARIDTGWSGFDTFRNDSGPGQSLGPRAVGLAAANAVDALFIEWSDGVFQSEIGLEGERLHAIVETQRQISSCPVIFAWDGTKHRFLTDCLGVGGVGYLVSIAKDPETGRLVPTYAEPRPWERVILPEGSIAPRDGLYDIRLGEPMEEVCYLDAARLVRFDLPAGWSMTVDERLGFAEPLPTGAPIFYRERRAPVRALVGDGPDGPFEDATEAIRTTDGVAAAEGTVDPRFIGNLARPRTLVLEFDAPLDGLPGEPVLVGRGWIEYPYSQTTFASWQAGVAPVAPDLEARGGDGRWHRIHQPSFTPAGMPRECSLPLGRLPEGTTALRMTWSQELYWDEFFVVGAEPCPDVVRTEQPLASARCADVGFAERIPRPQRRPDYDYARRAPLWDTRHQAGFLTNFGDCTPLVAETDDAVAIFGPGEEIALSFQQRLPERRPAGGTTRYILEVDGWCKDMDLFTQDGDTVEPLPMRRDARGATLLDPVSADRRLRLHEQFNQRFMQGR
jgi:tetratricopeptide (TPR) repeat protein